MTQNSPESSNNIGQLGANDDELCLGIHNDDLERAFDVAAKVGRAVAEKAAPFLRVSRDDIAEVSKVVWEFWFGPRP